MIFLFIFCTFHSTSFERLPCCSDDSTRRTIFCVSTFCVYFWMRLCLREINKKYVWRKNWRGLSMRWGYEEVLVLRLLFTDFPVQLLFEDKSFIFVSCLKFFRRIWIISPQGNIVDKDCYVSAFEFRSLAFPRNFLFSSWSKPNLWATFMTTYSYVGRHCHSFRFKSSAKQVLERISSFLSIDECSYRHR